MMNFRHGAFVSITLAMAIANVGCIDGGESSAWQSAELGEAEQAMGEASCATGAATATFTGGADYMSPRTYNASGCFKAVKVDIDNYQDREGAAVYWADTGLTNQTDCERSWLGTYLYEWDGSQFVAIDVKSVRGTWVVPGTPPPPVPARSPYCEHPYAYFGQDIMIKGNSYRITASARTDQTGGAPTRIVYIETTAVP
jgi:hypothetical protein